MPAVSAVTFNNAGTELGQSLTPITQSTGHKRFVVPVDVASTGDRPVNTIDGNNQANVRQGVYGNASDKQRAHMGHSQGNPRGKYMRRLFMIFTAMLIPVAGLTLGFAAGTASAGNLKITCTTITGNVSADITVSGCTGGNTGGSSVPQPALDLATGGTTDWVSGSTTTIGTPATTSIPPTKCPGYVKPPKGTTPPNPSALSVLATVTGDTGDGIFIPGTATAEVCIGTDGTITALKSFVFEYTGSSITCTAASGNISGNLTVSDCTGGNTGGGSSSFVALDLATGGTIPWLSGGSTTIGVPTTAATSAKSCPGYVKDGPSNPSAESFTATVTADTGDGLKLPGSAKGAVCIAADGTLSILKPLTAK